MPGAVNEARFKIEGTPSEDAGGDRGYDAQPGQTLDVTLEVDPSPALSVTYSVYDSAISDSPLASKDAPELAWTEGGQSSVTPSDVNDTVHLDMPDTGVHSWIIRCVASTPDGQEIFERLIVLRAPSEPALRKLVPAEAGQYSSRGSSDDQNELIEALASLVGGGPTSVVTDDFHVIGGDWSKHEVAGGTASIIDGETGVAVDAGAGILSLSGTTAGDEAGVYDTVSFFNGDHNPVFKARVRTPSDLTNTRLYVSISDNADMGAAGANHATIRTSASSWDVLCKSSDGGSSDIDTGLGTCSANTWYELKVEITSGSTAKFYVDGVLVGTLDASGSVPNGSDKLGRVIKSVKIGTTSADPAYVDHAVLRLDRLEYGGPI